MKLITDLFRLQYIKINECTCYYHAKYRRSSVHSNNKYTLDSNKVVGSVVLN